MSEPGTIQSSIDRGYRLVAAHELIHPFCSHSADLDLGALRDRLGPDFNLVDRRAWFVSRLCCSACGRHGNMTIIIIPPSDPVAHAPQGIEAGAGRP